MTSNAIELKKARETERHNRASLKETKRANLEKERETRNINKAKGLESLMKLGGTIAGLAANDPSWYNMDKQMVADTANVSFNTPLGYPVNNILGTGLQADYNQYTHPGICIIKYFPTIGGVSQVGDISSIASKNIYAFVRHANSGSRNYEAADLMMYLYAIAEAYSYHAFLRRLYSLALTSKGANRYYINAMIESQGVSADSLRDNLASFRAYINSYAVRVNSFYAPNTLPLFTRRYWMNTGIFKDSAIKKSQEYMYVQDSFGVYNDIEGKVEFSPGQFGPDISTKHTFGSLTSIGNRIIDGLINSEDAGIMSGDILKAYGESKMLFLQNTDETFHIESIYSEEVLSQITNTTLVGKPISGYDIRQRLDNNKYISEIFQGDYLTQQSTAQSLDNFGSPVLLNSNRIGILVQPCSYGTGSSAKGFVMPTDGFKQIILNMYKDAPTNDDIMVATRMIAIPDNIRPTTMEPRAAYRANITEAADEDTQWGTPLKYFGTEVAIYAYLVTLDDVDPTQFTYKFYKTINLRTNDNFNADVLGTIDRASKFDWAPIFFYASFNSNADNNYVLERFISSSYDGANYASVSAEAIGNMHYTACISELGIPLLGSTVRSR